MNWKSNNKTIEEWATDLRNGKTLRFNVYFFNEFYEVYNFWWPNTILILEREYNLITFKYQKSKP